MITFDETLRALYFLSGRQQDWMAGVNEEADGTIVAKYRFRYDHPDSSPDEANSDKDRRNWYEMKTKTEPMAHVLEAMGEMFYMLQATGYMPEGGVAYKRVRGSMPFMEMVEEFRKQPFVRVREVVKP